MDESDYCHVSKHHGRDLDWSEMPTEQIVVLKCREILGTNAAFKGLGLDTL